MPESRIGASEPPPTPRYHAGYGAAGESNREGFKESSPGQPQNHVGFGATPGIPRGAPAPPSGARTFFRNVWETAKVFIVSLVIIIPIRAYVAQPFFVRGASMVPNFGDGEYLIIDELSSKVKFRSWQRGDVVVFRYPLDHTQYYIKRIVGLPSERVRIANGRMTIFNAEFPRGVLLDESAYLPATERTEGVTDLTLRDTEVLVLGDNRDHSSDSRAWGPLPMDLIVGRAWVRAFPLARAEVLETPWYGSLTTDAETTSVTQ